MMDEKDVFIAILKLVAIGSGCEEDMSNDLEAIIRCSSPSGKVTAGTAIKEFMEAHVGEAAGF